MLLLVYSLDIICLNQIKTNRFHNGNWFQNECTLTIKMIQLKVSFKCDGLGVLRKKQWGTLFKSIVNDELNKQKLFTHNHNFKLNMISHSNHQIIWH